MTTYIPFLFVVAGYLFGSISSAIIVCKLMGLPDPRAEGSHNPGATNVLRIGGKKPAAITLFFDMLKGTLPVAAAQFLQADATIVAMTGLAAFIGHLYPVFFGFKGGKGVATGLGVLLGWHWQYFLFTAGVWLIASKVFRISSLAALIAFAVTPIYFWIMAAPETYLTTIIPIVVLIFARHKTNIQRLFAGKEDQIESKD